MPKPTQTKTTAAPKVRRFSQWNLSFHCSVCLLGTLNKSKTLGNTGKKKDTAHRPTDRGEANSPIIHHQKSKETSFSFIESFIIFWYSSSKTMLFTKAAGILKTAASRCGTAAAAKSPATSRKLSAEAASEASSGGDSLAMAVGTTFVTYCIADFLSNFIQHPTQKVSSS
jgi:hypothetical protein